MAYDPFKYIGLADTVAIDAFGRLRTSEPTTLFDCQQVYGDDAHVWENAFAGAGAVSNRLAEASVRISTGNTASGSKATRSTRQYFRYQPGKSQMVLTTFCLGPADANGRQRVGYFDANNGIFLERSGLTDMAIVQRTNTGGSVSDAVRIERAAWLDPLDGSGPSTINYNFERSTILAIDFQYLGVGRVRVGFDINGVIVPVAAFNNAGVRNTVYMASGCLPVRMEVENTGVTSAAMYLDHICSAVASEGGFQGAIGKQFSGPLAAATPLTTNARRPIFSLRAKTTGPNGVRNIGLIIPLNVAVLVTGSSPILWELVKNPASLTGASFADYDANNSIAQVDRAATALTGGIVTQSGFLAAGGGLRESMAGGVFKDMPLVYSALGNVQDTVSLVCTPIGGNSASTGSLTWQEQF